MKLRTTVHLFILFITVWNSVGSIHRRRKKYVRAYLHVNHMIGEHMRSHVAFVLDFLVKTLLMIDGWTKINCSRGIERNLNSNWFSMRVCF